VRVVGSGATDYALGLGLLPAGPGNELSQGMYTFAGASAACDANEACRGFLFAGTTQQPGTQTKVWFKNTTAGFLAAPGWVAWIKVSRAPSGTPLAGFAPAPSSGAAALAAASSEFV
jgi:hypothetical protein